MKYKVGDEFIHKETGESYKLEVVNPNRGFFPYKFYGTNWYCTEKHIDDDLTKRNKEVVKIKSDKEISCEQCTYSYTGSPPDVSSLLCSKCDYFDSKTDDYVICYNETMIKRIKDTNDEYKEEEEKEMKIVCPKDSNIALYGEICKNCEYHLCIDAYSNIWNCTYEKQELKLKRLVLEIPKNNELITLASLINKGACENSLKQLASKYGNFEFKKETLIQKIRDNQDELSYCRVYWVETNFPDNTENEDCVVYDRVKHKIVLLNRDGTKYILFCTIHGKVVSEINYDSTIYGHEDYKYLKQYIDGEVCSDDIVYMIEDEDQLAEVMKKYFDVFSRR